MDRQYNQVGSVIIRTIEECSELIHILCKADRFGMDNYHPEDGHMTPNRTLIQLEIDDVLRVLNELEKYLSTGEKIRCESTLSHEATEKEVMLVIKNFDLTCEIETKYHYRQKLAEELLKHFHITKRGAQ